VNKGLVYIDDIQTYKSGQAVNPPPQTDVKPAAANPPSAEQPDEPEKQRNPLLPFCGSMLTALMGVSMTILRIFSI
jgi:hypothetical protein